MNTHGVADTMYEMQGLSNDLLPACIVSTTFPAVPAPPSLTLAAFATAGYVKDGPTLVYVTQEAHTVTLTGADGNYWLALTQDTFTTYASYTRVAGTHYAWRANATEPASVDGLLVFCQLVVSGGAITTVTPLTKVTSQPMSKQLSNAVAITGGYARGLTDVAVVTDADSTAYYTNRTAGGNRYAVYGAGTAPSYFGGTVQMVGNVGIFSPPSGSAGLWINYLKASRWGLIFQATDNDTGPVAAILFKATNSADVGSITCTISSTSYNTSSDARLKRSIAPLTAALERVRALRPVQFLWKADDSPGVGFVAEEVAQVVEGVVTGDPDAVNEDGSIAPQQMDHSKLVPYLVGAVQALLARVEALEARLA
jgi:hypothetical protein